MLYKHNLQKPLEIAKFQYCKLTQDSSWFIIQETASAVLENWIKSLENSYIYTFFFLTKIATQIATQIWPSRASDYFSKNNQPTGSHFTDTTVLVFSQVTTTMSKNRLFKEENNQSTTEGLLSYMSDHFKFYSLSSQFKIFKLKDQFTGSLTGSQLWEEAARKEGVTFFRGGGCIFCIKII